METFSILKTVKDNLVGKNIKYCTHQWPVTQAYCVFKKKSNNVTDEQFESGNPRFRMLVHRTKNIGIQKIYDTNKIVDVKVELGCYDENDSIVLILDNNKEFSLSVNDELKEIEKNLYFFN